MEFTESQQFEPVQFGKSFVFHQPKAEYSVHPHASDTEDQLSVISDQPKATLTTKEPGIFCLSNFLHVYIESILRNSTNAYHLWYSSDT